MRVDHGAGRWKAIPIRLINDERLRLDTRGFAAWLLARPDGWQIRSSALPRLLSSERERVGRDKTRRFFRELESAKYLTRTRWRATNGRWIWHYCFRPDPSSIEMPRATIDGLAGEQYVGPVKRHDNAPKASLDPLEQVVTGRFQAGKKSNFPQIELWRYRTPKDLIACEMDFTPN